MTERDDRVERVARALFEDDKTPWSSLTWEALDAEDCDLWRRQARAAIAAAEPQPADKAEVQNVIAVSFDLPNIFMGGPSATSKGRARRLHDYLDSHGYVICKKPLPPPPASKPAR